MNTLLLWLSIFLCLAAIGALQFRLFGGTVKTRSPGNVASFFFMHEIVDKQQRNLLSVIALIPLSFVFLIVAYHAETFGKALVQTYLEYFKQEKALEPFISPDLVSNIPEPLYPIIILVASFLIFGAQLRFLFIRIEKGVVFVTGVISRTNELLDEFSTALLNKLSYENVIEVLEAERQNKVPLAEEFEETPEKSKLSFELLHLAKSEVAGSGLRESLLKVLGNKFDEFLDDDDLSFLTGNGENEDQALESPPNHLINWFHIYAGAMAFVVVCGLYVGITPMAAEFFGAHEITWPKYEYFSDLAWSIAWVTLATIIPTIVGVLFFARRSENLHETRTQTLFMVLSLVFLFSLVVNFTFMVPWLIEVYVGERAGSDAGFGFPEFVYLFTHSLIPGFAVMAIALVDPQKILSRTDIIFAVGVICLGHLLAYLTFELAADMNIAYYWHQALLGFVLSTAALLILAVFCGVREIPAADRSPT